jgi:hypothetical protein
LASIWIGRYQLLREVMAMKPLTSWSTLRLLHLGHGGFFLLLSEMLMISLNSLPQAWH